MVISLCPEERLLEWVFNSLQGRQSDLFTLRQVRAQLPDSFEVSEAFHQRWQPLVQRLVTQTILDLLQGDTFWVSDEWGDAPLDVTQAAFWEALELHVSAQPITLLWQFMLHPAKLPLLRLPTLASGDLLLLIALDVQSRGFTRPLAAESLPRQVKNWPHWSWPVSATLLRYVLRRLPPDPTPLPLADLWQSEFPLPLRPLLVAVTALALSHYNLLAPVLKLQRQAAWLVQIQTIQAVIADWLQELNGPAGRHLRNTLNRYELPRLLDTLVQHTGYFI